MSLFSSDFRPTEITVVVSLVALLVLLPPLLGLWIASDSPWYLPYVVWLVIIVLAWGLQRLLSKHAL